MQTLEDGDMALFDMGAEYQFYGSDITCSFPVGDIYFMLFHSKWSCKFLHFMLLLELKYRKLF